MNIVENIFVESGKDVYYWGEIRLLFLNVNMGECENRMGALYIIKSEYALLCCELIV